VGHLNQKPNSVLVFQNGFGFEMGMGLEDPWPSSELRV